MKPCAFDYVRVDTLDEALSVLADVNFDGKILAGGQSLMPLLNMRLSQPSVLLDINRIAELGTTQHGVAEDGSELLEVGALVRQRQVEVAVSFHRYCLQRISAASWRFRPDGRCLHYRP